MAGALSSLGVILKYASNVEENGVAKGTLKTLEDKSVQLLKADGSIMKVLGKFIVEPVAVVSEDLKDTDELDSILGLHMDMFVGYYMQVFDVLKDHYGLNINTIIDALATDNGGLSRVIAMGAKEGIKLSSENDDIRDYVSELLASADAVVGEDGMLRLGVEARHTRTEFKDAVETGDSNNVVDDVVGRMDMVRHNQLEVDKVLNKAGYGRSKVGATAALNRDTASTPVALSTATKDLLIPNAIQRTINVTAEMPMNEPGTNGSFHTRKIIIPITIKLAVIFVTTESLLESISTKTDDYAFSSRLDDYRSGAISVMDFVFATDLVSKYKNKKLGKKDTLGELMKERELSSNSKLLSNRFAGFEKYYNMYIISPETKSDIEKLLKSKISSTKGKDKFLEAANGLSVTVVDPDYERIQIMVKDIRGKTDLSFRAAIKKDKAGSDYSEIIKALMASKPPAF